jgi:small subunit ribosomal protein S17
MAEEKAEAKAEAEVGEQRGKGRVLLGTVRSDKMQKTVVVEVTHRVLHRAYKKYVTRRVRYKAHDEQGECHLGDKVQIVECRPLSRDKRWRVQKLVEKAR